MREFKIAVAGSRKAARWKNIKITWPDLCSRLRKTVYTSETAEEYRAMDKDARDAAKHHHVHDDRQGELDKPPQRTQDGLRILHLDGTLYKQGP